VVDDLADLRDRLTRGHLAVAAERPLPVDGRAFRRSWWDGAAWVPALVVWLPGPGRGTRCRLVEMGGQVIALPAAGWRARRAIRRLRRRATVDPRLLAFARRQPAPTTDSAPRVAVVHQRTDMPHGRPTMPRTRRSIPPPLIELQQGADAVRCAHANCAALVPIPPPGRLITADVVCTRCGRAAFELARHPTLRAIQRVS
jgi:hypothetical protein